MTITTRRAALQLGGFWFLAWTGCLRVEAQEADLAEDPSDAKRRDRYVEQLESNQAIFMRLRERAEALFSRQPVLKQEFLSAVQEVKMADSTLRLTPEVQAIENVRAIPSSRSSSSSSKASPSTQFFAWYTLRDNTLQRQRLMLQLNAAQQKSQQSYQNLLSNRAAILEIVEQADEAFNEFNRLADLLGRRSTLENIAAQQLSRTWLEGDPRHAGAILIYAYALRNEGRYDECQRWLEQLDQNYPAMGVIRRTVQAQIAFIQDNPKRVASELNETAAAAKKLGVPELFLVRGWIGMADKQWARARQNASIAIQLAPKNLECTILMALSHVADRPRLARDSLKVLRDAQSRTAPSDWHYHEALALVHAAAGDKTLALKAFDYALDATPSQFRTELADERAAFVGGKIPEVDWKARLRAQWTSRT